MPKTILIIASEPSGSRMGAALMAELNQRHKGLRWAGVGGPDMQQQGLQALFPLQDLAVMGLVEVVPAIPRILGRLRQIKAWAQREKPDLIITIDGQDFSKRVAQALKPLGVPHVQYVAPKVWAWRPWRVHKLKTLYTALMCNLPFEAPWFAAAGLPTTYVGHPMVERLAQVKTPTATALQLALLPGSRRSELQRHWPIFLATYRRLKKLQPPLSGLLVLPDQAAIERCRALAPWADDEGIAVVTGEARFAALAQCRAALAKSGTNNLELAMLNIPAVMAYRMNRLSYWVAKRLVTVKVYSLPNLILNPPVAPGQPERRIQVVYPEFVQHGVKPETLGRALYPLLTDRKSGAAQQKRLAEIRAAMQTERAPSVLAAEVMERYLGPTPKR